MKAFKSATLCILMITACSRSGAFEPRLDPSAPQSAREIGGSVDVVRLDPLANTVTIEGWGLITNKTKAPQLRLYVSGATAITSAERMARPDVVDAVGNKDLETSGFRIVVAIAPGAIVDEICLTTDDRHYGPRLLPSVSPDAISCTSLTK